MNKSKNNYIVAVSALIFLFPSITYSQSGSETEESELETLTVIGQLQRADTATIIDLDEIESKRASVAFDVLETKPGLNVVRRLGLTGAGLSRLTIRGNGGVGPAGIQVFVDGRPDATVSFAHPTPSALALGNINHIEVVHGPSPVLYGSGKTGVVNIVSANPDPGLHGSLELSFGRFDTFENSAELSYAGENGYARLGVSHRGTDGDNPNSEAEILGFNFRGGFNINDVFDVTVTAARNEDEFEVFNEFFVPGPFTDPRTENLDLTQTVFDLTLNADWQNVQSSLKFFNDDLDPTSQVLDGPEERADISERGVRFKTTWLASENTTFIGGIDYLEAQADNSPVLPPFGGPGLAIARDRLEVELSVASVYAAADFKLSDTFSISGGLRQTDHSEYGSVVSSELNLLLTPVISDTSHPLYGSAFRARATRGYQSPTLQQLFGIFRGGRNGPANPDLDPEIITQVEIGFNKTFSRGSFDIVVYSQEGEDLIEIPATPPPPPPDIQNAIEYSNQGVEAKFNYSLTDSISTTLGFSIADFDQETNRFLRTPERTVDVGISYDKNKFSASLFGRYATDTFDIAVAPPNSPQVELDSYFVADLKLNYDFRDNIRGFFGIDNITDEEFELVVGIPANSISAYVGISLGF